MDPRQLFVDERLTGICAYCGGAPEYQGPRAARILLDRPYPADLPVVDACLSCNQGSSADEEYLACLLECAASGTADSAKVGRKDIARILASFYPVFPVSDRRLLRRSCVRKGAYPRST